MDATVILATCLNIFCRPVTPPTWQQHSPTVAATTQQDSRRPHKNCVGRAQRTQQRVWGAHPASKLPKSQCDGILFLSRSHNPQGPKHLLLTSQYRILQDTLTWSLSTSWLVGADLEAWRGPTLHYTGGHNVMTDVVKYLTRKTLLCTLVYICVCTHSWLNPVQRMYLVAPLSCEYS